MNQVAFADPIHGNVVLAFDGFVVELFTEKFGSVGRLIHGLLRVEIGDPDGRGNRQVNFVPGGHGGGFSLTVPGEAWPKVESMLRQMS